MTLGTLIRFNLKYYRRHAPLSLLCVAGISLGVGIVVAVQLINNSALSSVEAWVDFLSGRATHSIVSNYSMIDENHFLSIWTHPSVSAATPVIEVVSTTLETGPTPVRFLGIDPFLDKQFRNFTPPGQDQGELALFLSARRPSVYLSKSLMTEHGLEAGDTLSALSAGIEKPLTILGPIHEPAGVATAEGLAIMDISNAQEIFGRQGRIDHIDLIIEKDRARLESDLPSGLRLTDKGARKSSLKALLYSFQLNLAAMSLLALLVGIFLIYNFSMFSALSRREDLSLLMTLGAKRKELVAAFLLESLILGALGAGLGIGFGYLVALLSMERVSSTISDIYFFLHVDQIRLTANIALSGLAVGFAATLTGAGTPAIEVAGTPPVVGMKRRSIEDRAQSMKGGLTLLGTILFLASILAAWASRFSIFWGFLSAFGVTLAFALLTPSLLWSFCRYASIALKKATGSLTGFMAARNISASLSRTSIAVAALAVALSMTIGVDTMIHSFRESVRLWLEGALQGDLYISPSTTKWEHTLPPELVESLMKDPDMAGVERYATHEVYLDDRPVRLRVIDGATLERFAHFHFLDKGVDPWEELKQGGLFISESLAYKSGLSRGDTIELETPNGPKSFPIAAMIRDYSSDQGAIQMDRETFLQSWDDRSVQSMALFLKPGVDPQGVRSRIMAKFPGLGRAMATNQSMRENILTIFDKTFAPTGALKGVTLVVALLGVAAALMAIFIERSNEMKLLSYLGMRPGQLMVMNLYQALLMGLAAFLISVVCGIALTYIITLAINYRSFGWSVDIRFDIWIFLKTFLLAGLACLASSIYPGWKILGAAARGQVEGE